MNYVMFSDLTDPDYGQHDTEGDEENTDDNRDDNQDSSEEEDSSVSAEVLFERFSMTNRYGQTYDFDLYKRLRV